MKNFVACFDFYYSAVLPNVTRKCKGCPSTMKNLSRSQKFICQWFKFWAVKIVPYVWFWKVHNFLLHVIFILTSLLASLHTSMCMCPLTELSSIYRMFHLLCTYIKWPYLYRRLISENFSCWFTRGCLEDLELLSEMTRHGGLNGLYQQETYR